MENLPGEMNLVLREIDRYIAARLPSEVSEPPTEPGPEVREVASLLARKTVVLIGGDCRSLAGQALESQFGLKKLHWISTVEHESIEPFEAQIARPEVAVVLLAIRWSSHSYGEIRHFCEKHGKLFVRLPGGYNPNQVAIQVLSQCGDRLRKEQM